MHFSIDSIVKSTGTNQYKVHVRQRLHHAMNFANDNRIDLTFFSRDKREYTVKKAEFSGQTGIIDVNIPFEPQFGIVDFYEKLADAIVDTNLWISNKGMIECPQAYFISNIQSVEDTVFMRMEHNLVKPDELKTNNPLIYRISDNHYWRIEYTDNASINGKLMFRYDIRNSDSYDYQLLQGYSVNDLVLLHRKNAGDDWQGISFNHIRPGVSGFLETTYLLSGEYVFAIGDPSISSIADNMAINEVKIYPNPSNGSFNLLMNSNCTTHFSIFDIYGKKLQTGKIDASNTKLDMKKYADGIYFIQLNSPDIQKTMKIVIQ